MFWDNMFWAQYVLGQYVFTTCFGLYVLVPFPNKPSITSPLDKAIIYMSMLEITDAPFYRML